MSDPPLLVVAVGGNALLRRGERIGIDAQRANVARAARALAPLCDGHRVAVVHGNGPQVGLLALETADGPSPMPLDVLDAESQGQIGSLLGLGLANELGGREVVTLVTHVTVDPADPAFALPTKPIGPVYDDVTARRLAAERGWVVAPDGVHWRRVVASPEPREIVELAAIARLVDGGSVVLCAGGGGVPVAVEQGRYQAREAVIDKDLAAALLAERLHAATLVLLTDVDAVYERFGTPEARPLTRLTIGEAERLDLPPGSMGPKVRAAARFVAATGRPAAVGALDRAPDVAAGRSGTRVVP